MIKIFSLMFIVLAMVIPRENSSQIIDPDKDKIPFCGIDNKAFVSGEKLTYTIYYNWGFVWLPAGEAVFDVKEDEENYLYTVYGKTFPAYNWVFEVDDYFYSYVDKETLLPVRAKRNINEGGYRIKNDIRFDQQENFAVSEVVINERQPKTVVKKFDSCMYDILSVIYSLRNIDKSTLTPGDFIPFSMMLDDEIYPLKLEYVGNKSVVEVKNLGMYEAVEISPTVIKGRVFAKNERMKIWISTAKSNIPLIIESPLAVGKIKVVLKEYSNLRYPLLKAQP